MTGARTPSPGRPRRGPPSFRHWPEVAAASLVLALGLGLGSLLIGERRRPAEVVLGELQPTSSIPLSPGAVSQMPQETAPAPSAPAASGSAASGPAPSGQSQARAGTIPPAPAPPPAPKIPPPVLPEPRRLPDPPKPQASPAPTVQPPAAQTQAPAAQTPAAQPPTAQAPAAQPPAAQAQAPAAAQSPAAQTPKAQTPTAQPPAAQPQPAPEPAVPAQAEPANPAPAPSVAPAVVPSAQRTPLRSEYRVMLGTFGSEAALRSATSQVGALGYTVYAIDLGNQFVAQVGPFADEATGQQAAADIRRSYARAELYPPRGRSLQSSAPAVDQAPAATPAQTQTSAQSQAPDASEDASAPAPASAATPPATRPAPAGPVYVQVGAFNTVEGAQRLVEQLRDQGFAPSVNAPESGKVTVLFGPLSGDALLATESRLDAAGLDHFRLQ